MTALHEHGNGNVKPGKWLSCYFGVFPMGLLLKEPFLETKSVDGATLGSGSQLIAFLVGLFNFLMVGWKCAMFSHPSKTTLPQKHDLIANSSFRDENTIEFEEILHPRTSNGRPLGLVRT